MKYVIGLLMCLCFSPVLAAEYMIVSGGDLLRVRDEPGFDAKVVTRLKRGKLVIALQQWQKWTQIYYIEHAEGKKQRLKGWIRTGYLQPEVQQTVPGVLALNLASSEIRCITAEENNLVIGCQMVMQYALPSSSFQQAQVGCGAELLIRTRDLQERIVPVKKKETHQLKAEQSDYFMKVVLPMSLEQEVVAVSLIGSRCAVQAAQ